MKSAAPSSPLPRLDPTQIRAWVGPEAYRRGRWYYRQGRVRHPRRYGAELRALCQGQASEPYRVQVRLGSDGVAAARCTCPVGGQGRCKHVAAVLILWTAEPDAFAPTPPVAERLASWDRAALIALVEALIDRHPDLEAFLPLFQPPAAPTDEAPREERGREG